MTQPKKNSRRASGVLMHPTSLPGQFGIGDLGSTAHAWIDTLVAARQKWWQILPLGPTGFGDSPYQAFSAFAGNPFLVSPQVIVEEGLIHASDLIGFKFPSERVDFGPVIDFKNKMLSRAWANFQQGSAPGLRGPFDAFRHEQSSWLDDYALFMALKDAQQGHSWLRWPDELRRRKPEAMAQAKRQLADAVGLHQFRQFLFFRQWQQLRAYARERGLKIIGDIPIFVSSDSADVWANPELFCLDEHRQPRVVAGVPPDYFSATGQLWGNPLYDWEALARTGHAWWIARLRSTLTLVDIIRLDHFRGFEAYWEIPAGMPTAEIGRWVPGPGANLLQTLHQALNGLPLIAEDLGVITPEVEKLRDDFNLPGMRVLQFAFDGKSENPFLPHHFVANTIVYTGTHDNDTSRGWYGSAPELERDHLRRYLARDGSEVAWDLIRLAWSSVADLAIAPLQDVLNLGTEARMNFPGRPDGNWAWRFTSNQLHRGGLDRLAELTSLYGRD